VGKILPKFNPHVWTKNTHPGHAVHH